MPVLRLNRSVEHDGKTFHSIMVDEPTVGAIEAFENAKAAGKSDTSAMVELLAVDSCMPADAIRKIRASDLARISDMIAPFSESAPTGQGGAVSSPTSPQS